MIWIRRLLVVPLLLLFLVLFIVAIVAFRVNGTVLQAGFYTGVLERLDFYNFIYDDALPVALEEAGVDVEDLGLGISLSHERIAADVKRVLPPEWVESTLEQVIDEAVPYFTDQTDNFSITVELADRVEAAVEVAEGIIQNAAIYDYLFDELVGPELEDNDLLTGLPYGLSLTPDKVVAGLKEVMPEPWLRARIDEVLDEVVPYATGKNSDFTIVIPLQDRTEVELAVLEGWLQEGLEGDTYQYLLEEQFAPIIQSSLGGSVTLPLGVGLTEQEVVDAVAQVLPAEWVGERVSDAFDALGPYVTGETDSFTVVIPIQDRMQAAVDLLVATTDAKYQAIYDSLPVCTPLQLLTLDLSLTAPLECVPPGISYDDLKGLLGLDVVAQLSESIVSQLPSTTTFTEQDLQAALSSTGAEEIFQDARELLRDGLVFTEQDLRRVILDNTDQDTLDLFDDVRRYLKEGFTFTEEDVREELGADFDDVDSGRGYLGLFRTYLWVTIPVLLLVAAGIGFLGGRNWWSRMGWAGIPLVLAGGLMAGVTGVGTSIGTRFTNDAIQGLDVAQVFIDKLLDVQDELINSFLNPMLLQSVVVLAVGVVLIGAGVYGSFIRRSPTSATPGA